MVWEADLFFDVDRFDCFDVYLFDCFYEDLFYCLDVDLFVLGTALFDGRARVEAGFVLIGGSTIYTTLTSGAISNNVKVAFAYKSGSFAFYVNGVQVGTSSASLTISPTLTQFD